MTTKQFRKMTVFALRMVRVSTTPRWQPQLRELVADFLYRIGPNCNGDFAHMLDWDNSDYYYIETFTECRRKGWHPLLCDEVTRFIWDMEDECRLPRRSGWNAPTKESVMALKLKCCIRAAADVAVAPSAGVLGWTVGDIRAMWKNRPIPKWVTDSLEKDITSASNETPVWL